MEFAAGAQIADRYRLEQQLGEGGFGTVWRAAYLDGSAWVAVKILKESGPSMRRRFMGEARALARLDHPGCVRILDFEVLDDGTPIVVTEYVPGVALEQWLAEGPPLEARIEAARQLAAALHHAHAHQVTHRDLKPANILVVGGRTHPQVKVIDFGIAKITGDRQTTDVTKTGEVVGTPGFMSPEQLRASPDIGAPSDMYALGVVFFVLFEGRLPFDGATQLEVAMAHLLTPAPELGPHCPPELRQIVRRMLDKEPGRRPTAASVLRVLQGGAADEDRVAMRGRGDKARMERRGPTTRGVALGLCAIVAAVSGYVALVDDEAAVPAVPRNQPATVRALLRGAPGEAAARPTPSPPPGADAGAGDDAAGARDGCGGERLQGLHQFERTQRGVTRSVPVRLPKGYDPGVRAPVLIVFHDLLQTPVHLLTMTPLVELADAMGFVMVAPPDDLEQRDVWLLEEDWQHVLDDIDHLDAELCLDRQRIFMFGQGNGGIGADQVACRLGGVRAIAMTGMRLWNPRDLCRRADPAPTLFMSPLDDAFAPVGGGTSCLPTMDMWSLDRHEQELRTAHRCQGEGRTVYSDELGQCIARDCDVPLTTCRVQGGRFWKSMPQSRNFLLDVCIGLPAKFDYIGRMREFFSAHDVVQ